MRRNPDRSRETEKRPCLPGAETQFGVENGGGAVDIHRDGLAFPQGQQGLDPFGDLDDVAGDNARRSRLSCKGHEARSAGICGFVKPMPESRDVGGNLGLPAVYLALDLAAFCDPGVKRDGLLPRAAVDIVQQVYSRGHRLINGRATGDRHACRRNRWRLRAMIDRRNKSRFKQLGLTLVWQVTPQHQPDHLRKTDISDEVLNRPPPDVDASGFHVDDGGRPPVRDVTHIALTSLSSAISAAE